MNKKCFDILCVPMDATLEEAKRSYKRLVKQWHPDQYGNDPKKQRIAHDRLTEINVAYREIVALLKNTTFPASPEPEPAKAAGRPATGARTVIKKASLFQRMASMFKNPKNKTHATHAETPEGPSRTARQGYGGEGHPASDFRRELKRAIRSQPRRATAGLSQEGRGRRIRRKHAGRAPGIGTVQRMPPTARRNRGDRVEKIRPVRRVGKIGE